MHVLAEGRALLSAPNTTNWSEVIDLLVAGDHTNAERLLDSKLDEQRHAANWPIVSAW